MEGLIFILFGLVLDICGALLIIKPLLNIIKKLDPKKQQGAPEKYAIQSTDEDTEWKYQNWARYGLMFLVIGFVLQILGNYLQYLDRI